MEKRKAEQRRQIHMFVADDRRNGPYERRDDDARRRERAHQLEKIERIRSFKDEDQTSPPVTPMITTKRVVYFGMALLAILVAVFLIK